MNIEEFEQGFAERSGVTVEWLRANGREAASCHCDADDCPGWQMAHVNYLEDMERLAILLPSEAATLAEIRQRRRAR